MKIIKKGFLLVIAVFATMMFLGGIIVLIEVWRAVDFPEGKPLVLVIYLLMTIGFGWLAFKCYKSVFNKEKTPQTKVSENSSQSVPQPQIAGQATTPVPAVNVKVVRQKVPQKTLNDMRMAYTGQKAVNDMRIIDESLKIMETTSDIDTFLSRYETAMRCVLTLEQAKKAGQRIALPDGYSQSLASAKSKALAGVLYRSFNKELGEISKLKTENGKLNRINRYQEKLEGLYETEIQFVADEAYSDIMQKLEFLKNG